MSKGLKRRWLWFTIGLGLILLLLVDIWQADRARVARPFLPKGVVAAPGAKSVVAIVGSDDPDLSSPAPLTVSQEYVDNPHNDVEARLSKEQIEQMVYKALNLDTSERSIRNVVEPGDWVVVKPNIVTCPDGKNIHTAWGQRGWSRGTNRGQDHWGQTTDLRVVRAVIKYLIEEEGDARRITIAEGGAEWTKLGESNTNPDQEHDGWTVHWPPFDSLSYIDIINEFKDNDKGIQVDIVDLNYDDYLDKDGNSYPWTNHNPAGDPIPVPDPNGTGVTWFQRPEGYYVSKTLWECDKLINIPAMKTHDIPGETTIFKQYVGTYMHNAYEATWGKMGLHRYAGNEKVPNGFVDLFSYRPTDYAVVEGIWGVEGNGPQTGDDVKLNVIVAGGDPVATEAVTAQIMGFNPYDIYHLHLAAAKGFGTWDINQIEVVGRSIEEVRRPFRKPENWLTGPMGITRWLVNGPYEEASMDTDYLDGEATVRPKEGDEHNGHIWRVAQCELNDRSTLYLAEGSDLVTYAFTWVECNEEMAAYLVAEADDKIKVWLNGEPVVDRGKRWINQLVTLHQGLNPLLVKVLNTGGKGSMEVGLRDNDRNTPLGVQYLLVRPPTAVEESRHPKSSDFKLSQNFPNPFNSSTWVCFELSCPGHVNLSVYNTIGQRIRILVDKELPGGVPYTTFWNGKNEQGQDVGSGIYLCRLSLGNLHKTIKMTLLR